MTKLTKSRDQLNRLFADGTMPTGANFQDLIAAMATVGELTTQADRIDELEANSIVRLGRGDAGWTLALEDDSTSHITLAPDTALGLERGQTQVDLFGWSQGFGRVGMAIDKGSFQRAGMLDGVGLNAQPCSNKKHVLLEEPAGPAAMEIVVATSFMRMREKGIGGVLRKVIGMQNAAPEAIHAIATAQGPGSKPQLRRSTWSPFARTMFRCALELTILAILFTLLNSIPDKIDALLSLPEDIAITWKPWVGNVVSGLWFLRLIVQVYTARMNHVVLKWSNSKTDSENGHKPYQLLLKAPKPKQDENAKVSYHITALWG